MAAGVSLPDMRPWGRQPLTIPPTSVRAWVRLATWELWMGMLVGASVACGVLLIVTSPHHIITLTDLSNCYAPPPVTVPCERTLYSGGVMFVAFSALCGVMLLGVAAWFLWELWSASEPTPLTDEFLKLLDASFGHTWRNPLHWPWTRISWAYGFAVVGATLTIAITAAVWSALPLHHPPRPSVHVGATFTATD
jgi:hypothetical protein